MKKIFTGILISIFFVSVSFSQNSERSTSKVGTTAAQFLKIGAGARAIGMGGAYVAVSNDIYSTYYNPAGIAQVDETAEVAFNHANWLAGMNYDYVAGSLNLQGLGVIFGTLTSFSVPQDIVRTFQYPEGDGRTWDASSLAIGLGYARRLTDEFSVGFQFKYIREAIWTTSASGFALDVGTYYVTPFNGMVIGASITNFGSKMQLSGRDILFNYDPNGNSGSGPNDVLSQYSTDSFDIPLTFRLGLAMDVIKSRYFRATAAVDATHPNDNTEYVNSGLELSYNDLVAFRIGYKSLFLRNSEEGLTLGGGINYKFDDQFTLQFNYGWATYGVLNDVQFIDVGLKF